jgi:hypothetical protein
MINHFSPNFEQNQTEKTDNLKIENLGKLIAIYALEWKTIESASELDDNCNV